MTSTKERLARLEKLVCGSQVTVTLKDGNSQTWTPKQIFDVLVIAIEASAWGMPPEDPKEKELLNSLLDIADSDQESHKTLILARNMAIEVASYEH